MEGRGSHCDDAILLDDGDSSDPDQGFIEFVDLEDYEMSQMSDTLPINHAQTTIGKAPIAQMVAAIKSEPLQSDGPRCGPGQAKLQCQAKAGATAANIRKCHGELLRQRAEKSANPAPATLITIVTPTQQEQQPKPRLMGQKLGFAALTEDSWQPEQLSSEAAEDSGEASPGIAVDTPSTQHVPNLYTCEKCSRNYTFRRGLTRHTREHPNCDVELPTATTKALFEADRYACQKCSKSYSKKKSLNKHQRDHPNCESKTPDAGDDTEAEVGLPIETAGPNPLSERERYACEKCGKTYSRRHTVRIHQRENPNCETDGPSNSGTLRVPRAAAAPKKSAPKAQSDLPAAFPVFNSNHKRPVGQIPVGTLFYPGQIVSKQKYDAKRQRRHDRREKHEMKQGSMADQGLETIVFDDFDASEAGADPFDEEQDQEGPPFAIDGDLATETFDDNIATEIEVSQRPEATNSGNPPRTDFKVNNSPAFSNAARRSSQSLRGANQLEVVAVKSPATAHHNAEQQSGQTLHFQGTQPAIVTLPKAPNKQPAIAAELNASQVSEVESGDSDDLTFISAAPRPKVAGKGISAATLAAWEGDEDGQVPNIVYEYWVMRRQWATTLSVEDIVEATERTLGPFHTVAEANVVAIKEIYPTRNESEGQLTLTGWSYSCKHDADGLQTHNAEVAGLHIETLVSRELAPPRRRAGLPKNAFLTPRCVYVVHELFWDATLADDTVADGQSEPGTNVTAHGCFTILNMANKRAADIYLDAFMGNPPENSKQGIEKVEMAMAVRKELKELKEDGESFGRDFEHEVGGWTRIWVTEMIVDGPRN